MLKLFWNPEQGSARYYQFAHNNQSTKGTENRFLFIIFNIFLCLYYVNIICNMFLSI